MQQQKGLNEQNLQQILHVLLEEMQEKKLIPQLDDTQKEELVNTVSQKIIANGGVQNFDFDLAKNPEGIKNLMDLFKLSLAAEFAQNKEINPNANPNFLFDYTVLFNPESVNKDELKLQLKFLFSNLNQYYNNNLSEENIDKMSDVLSEELSKEMYFEQQNQLAENQNATDVLTDLLTSLYGMDPRVAGSRPSQVDEIIGNYAGLIDFNEGDANAYTFMAEQNRVDLGQPDYTAKEAFRITNALSADAEMSETLSNAISYVNHPSPSFTVK